MASSQVQAAGLSEADGDDVAQEGQALAVQLARRAWCLASSGHSSLMI